MGQAEISRTFVLTPRATPAASSKRWLPRLTGHARRHWVMSRTTQVSAVLRRPLRDLERPAYCRAIAIFRSFALSWMQDSR
jgi:hypothetical protein